MKKIWLLGIALVAVLAISLLSGCGSYESNLTGDASDIKLNLSNQQEGIWVNGEGKVSAVPDIGILQIGIESQEQSVSLAQSQAAEAMDRVMTALSSNKIKDKDIQTKYFNISKVTRWDDGKRQEVVIGYRVTNTVSVKVRNLDNAGKIIDDVAREGGDLIRIDGISFTIEDPTEYRQEAREKAMSDAYSKAEQLASLAKVKLGKPIYISESFYFPYTNDYRMPMMEAAAPSAVTSISPGEMDITLSVQVTYSILN
jgi:uncharacterized protein YggE